MLYFQLQLTWLAPPNPDRAVKPNRLVTSYQLTEVPQSAVKMRAVPTLVTFALTEMRMETCQNIKRRSFAEKKV